MSSYRPFGPPPPWPPSPRANPNPPPQPPPNSNPNSNAPHPHHRQHHHHHHHPHYSSYSPNPNPYFNNPYGHHPYHHQRSHHPQQHFSFSGPPPSAPPPPSSYPRPLQNPRHVIYYSSSSSYAPSSLPPPHPPPPPPPPSSPIPPPPPPKNAALPPKPRQHRRPETEEERKARKKGEYERQRAEERRRHLLKQSQAMGSTAGTSSHGHHRHHDASGSGSRIMGRRTSLLTRDRIENRLKKPTTFLCKFKFRNELPDPTAQLKLLPIFKDNDPYTRCSLASLEKNYKPKLYVEPDLGIPLDLLDLSVYNRPKVCPPLDPEDEELLRDDEEPTLVKHEGIKIKERPSDKGLSWLVKTQYISPLSTDSAKLSLTEKQAKEMREAREGRNVSLDSLNNRERQIVAIEESFKAAKLPPVHHKDPSLKPEVLPLLPDLDRYDDWFVLVGFDSDPTADFEAYNKMDKSTRDELESKAIMKSFVVDGSDTTKPEKVLAYMVPEPDELTKDEDMSYSRVREYHWKVRGDDAEDPTTYLVNLGEKDARYLPLPKKFELQKKAKKGRSCYGVEQCPVPSKVNVRKKTSVTVRKKDIGDILVLKQRSLKNYESGSQHKIPQLDIIDQLNGAEELSD